MKIHKEKEQINVIGYMGKPEEREGRKIEYEGFAFHLCQSGSKWAIFEATTGKNFVAWKDTRKAVLSKLEESVTLHKDKLTEYLRSYNIAQEVLSK